MITGKNWLKYESGVFDVVHCFNFRHRVMTNPSIPQLRNRNRVRQVRPPVVGVCPL